VFEAIEIICDKVIISVEQGMNELVPFIIINTHRVEELGALAIHEACEHAPSKETSKQGI
jgi:hypothetical protein